MLTVYKSSELYEEIEAGTWQEATEIEKYEEVKKLVAELAIETEFAMLGASNPIMLRGSLPKHREQLISTLDTIINEVGEERLRSYRTNLKHL